MEMFKEFIRANDLKKFKLLYENEKTDFISFLELEESIILACRCGSYNLLPEIVKYHKSIAQETKLRCANDSLNVETVQWVHENLYVLPDEKRRQCLREFGRVLRSGGVLVFSSHNPRAILLRPDWDQQKLRDLAHKMVPQGKLWFSLLLAALTAGL